MFRNIKETGVKDHDTAFMALTTNLQNKESQL